MSDPEAEILIANDKEADRKDLSPDLKAEKEYNENQSIKFLGTEGEKGIRERSVEFQVTAESEDIDEELTQDNDNTVSSAGTSKDDDSYSFHWDEFAKGTESLSTDLLPDVMTTSSNKGSEPIPSAGTSLKSFEVMTLHPRIENSVDIQSLRTRSFETVPFHADMPSIAQSETSESLSAYEEEEERPKSDIKIDRKMYYQLYELYTDQLRKEKMKNKVLQTKVVDYYKSRKMYHVLYTERDSGGDQQKRYDRLLDQFELESENAAREQEQMEAEISNLRKKCNARKDDIELLFATLQEKEAALGKVLVSETDQSKQVSTARFIERYLKRQKCERVMLTEMRKENIKLRNMVSEKQELADALNYLGSNLRLMDYEHLRIDNRNLADKLEEREMAIATLRHLCQGASQVLAHVREKVDAIEKSIIQYKENLDEVNDDFLYAREQLTMLKSERKRYRKLATKLKEHVGLLTRPKLLLDLQDARDQVVEGRHKLEEYKHGCEFTSHKLKHVRSRMSSLVMELKTLKESRRGSKGTFSIL